MTHGLVETVVSAWWWHTMAPVSATQISVCVVDTGAGAVVYHYAVTTVSRGLCVCHLTINFIDNNIVIKQIVNILF